jgi:DNA-binding transcriptional LysR family regulator
MRGAPYRRVLSLLVALTLHLPSLISFRKPAVFSIERVEALREVAHHGNLTRAASAMRLSKSTISKYITELEAQVGVQLLHRSTRVVFVTDAGRHLLKRSVALVELAMRIQSELDAHGGSQA